MRHVIILLALCGGCSEPSKFTCETDEQCALPGTASKCVQAACAFADSACPSGLRFDRTAGARADQCVSDESRDLSTEGDLGDRDLAQPEEDLAGADLAGADLSGSPDMSVTADMAPPPPDMTPPPIVWTAKTVSTGDLRAIFGVNVNNVFTGGANGLAYRTTDKGATWSAIPIGINESITAIWGTSDTYLFAVTAQGSIVRWGGSSWSAPMRPTTGLSFNGIGGTGPSDVYAVGSAGKIYRSTDGSNWTDKSTTGIQQNVWGISASAVYVLSNTISGNTNVLRSVNQGTNWTPNSSGQTNYLYGAWGTSETNIYISGGNGTILRSTDFGATWTKLTTNVATAYLFGIWGIAGNIWAAGQSGTVLNSTDGLSWNMVNVGSSATFNGVWVGGARDIYLAGAGGVVVHGE